MEGNELGSIASNADQPYPFWYRYGGACYALRYTTVKGPMGILGWMQGGCTTYMVVLYFCYFLYKVGQATSGRSATVTSLQYHRSRLAWVTVQYRYFETQRCAVTISLLAPPHALRTVSHRR